MLSKVAILLLAVTVVGSNAVQFAELVPRDLSARTVNAPGGWSLAQTNAYTCPPGNPNCGSNWCCPITLACVHTGNEDIGEVCCPNDTDCSATFKTTPTCADSSWSLWNATFDTADGAGYFCCLPGQIGLQSGGCAEINSAYATSGPEAIQVSPGSATSIAQPATSASSTPSSSTPAGSATTTAAALLPSTTAIVSTIGTNTAGNRSAAPTPGQPTNGASTLPAGTATTTVTATLAKGEAAGLSLLRGVYLGGTLIAMFALALL